MQQIWTIPLVEIVKFVAKARTEEKRIKNVTTLLTNCSKHGVEVLADAAKEKMQN